MNSRSLMDNLINIRSKNGVEVNILLRKYIFDCFVLKLSKSQYKDYFIIKGGYLLSNIYGIENRSTMDIDASIKNALFKLDLLLKMLEDIVTIDIGDNSSFNVQSYSSIRDEDEYGGYRFVIEFKLDSITEKIKLDVATGDPITPREIRFRYCSFLTNDVIDVWSYNTETIIAEKLESIFSKLSNSSRMKDYYDLYLIYTFSFNDININHLNLAVENTFSKRSFVPNFKGDIDIIDNSFMLRTRWKSYQKNNDYAVSISFDDVVNCIKNLVEVIIN